MRWLLGWPGLALAMALAPPLAALAIRALTGGVSAAGPLVAALGAAVAWAAWRRRRAGRPLAHAEVKAVALRAAVALAALGAALYALAWPLHGGLPPEAALLGPFAAGGLAGLGGLALGLCGISVVEG